MTTLGWIFMTTSLTLVWGGTFWCFKKVLTSPRAKDEDSEPQLAVQWLLTEHKGRYFTTVAMGTFLMAMFVLGRWW